MQWELQCGGNLGKDNDAFDTVNGVVTKSEFWVTEERSENRQVAFETCRFNGGRLLDLETPQARICLKKLQDLHPSNYEVRFYTGLQLFGGNFIWDDVCRPANSDTLSFVTGDLSDYSTTHARPVCFQIQYRPGVAGYLSLNFKGRWTKCNHDRRMICEIPTTDKCEVAAHDRVTMRVDFPERILNLDEGDTRLCSEECNVQTLDDKPCWFFGMKGNLCHLWFAKSQPSFNPLKTNREDGFTIYAKDCFEVSIRNLPAGTLDDNHPSCHPESPNDASTGSTERASKDQPTTKIANTSDRKYRPTQSRNEGIEAISTIPGGASDKWLRGDTTESLGITNIDPSPTLIVTVQTPSGKDGAVAAPSVRIIEPAGLKLPGCQCACVKKINQTAEEKEEFTNEIVGNLTIDVKKTSANVRKYVSAKDDRPSAQKIGGVGAVMLVIAFGTPVLLDLSKVVIYFVKLGLNYRNRKKGKPVRINVEPFRSESDTTDE